MILMALEHLLLQKRIVDVDNLPMANQRIYNQDYT